MNASSPERRPILQTRNISKTFPAVQALRDVSLDIYPGEVHAIIGENGAGKSTLMKIISGAYQPDGGTLMLDGVPVRVTSPTHALALGISMVYQELSVFASGTVAENIFAGRLPITGPFGFVDEPRMNAEAQRVIEPFGVHLDPARRLRDLRFSERQITEICKAISLDAKLLLLDEPTSALTAGEITTLFEIIRRLRASGVAVVYISHRISEILEISDVVTVLRDGQKIATTRTAEATPEGLVAMMVGRTIDTFYPAHRTPAADTVLEVRALSTDLLRNVSFEVRRGEIFGIAGLVGSGRTELLRSIFGSDPRTAGEIILDGKPVEIRSVKAAMKHGIGFSPEDRRTQGLFNNLSVLDNIVATVLARLSTNGFIRQRAAAAEADRFVRQLDIKTPQLGHPVMNLSGGNQQKTVLARWLAIHPKVLLLDDPTAGIDAGAKHEIYVLLSQLAAQGVAIVFVSSELPELLGMCDRIAVLCTGRLVAMVSGAEATDNNVMAYAAGVRCQEPLPRPESTADQEVVE